MKKPFCLADLGLAEPGLDRPHPRRLNCLAFAIYFTAGVKEVRAWTIHQGDTAPLHCMSFTPTLSAVSFGAQTIGRQISLLYKGEAGAKKEAGKMRRREGVRRQRR